MHTINDVLGPIIVSGLDPFIADEISALSDQLDDMQQFSGDPNQPVINVNVNLGDDEDLPYRNAADSVPLYVADWNSFVGQDEVKEQLRIHIEASILNFESLGHTLLASGMPGVGKTTLARLIAQELGAKIHMMVPPFNMATLQEVLLKLRDGDFLFIDEIHKLADGGTRNAEKLLHIMEESALYVDGETIELPAFTLIGATTDADKLPEPLLDRFEIKPSFQPYTLSEMVRIAANFSKYFEVVLPPEILVAIAKASRRTPRVARELVQGARDLITVNGRVTPAELLKFKQFESDGLGRQHGAYLTNLFQHFGRERDGIWEYVAGEMTMANLLRENRQGVNRLERYLIECGYIDRTTSGRRLTPRGITRAQELLARRAHAAVH